MKHYKRVGDRRIHVVVAEKAFGGPLPSGAVVHHHDGDIHNNDPSNLVICPGDGYHFLLHARINAMAACGNPDHRPCAYCGEYDDPANMYQHTCKRQPGGKFRHRECFNAYMRKFHRKNKPPKGE